MTKKDLPRFLEPARFAKQLGVSPRRVRRWIQEGRVPFVRIGRYLRIPADALDRMLLEARP